MNTGRQGGGMDINEWWKRLTPVVRLMLMTEVAFSVVFPTAEQALYAALEGGLGLFGTLLVYVLLLPLSIIRSGLCVELGIGALFHVVLLAQVGCKVESSIFGDLLFDSGLQFPDYLYSRESMPANRRSVLVGSLRFVWFYLVHRLLQLPTTLLLGIRPIDNFTMALTYLYCATLPKDAKLQLMFGPAVRPQYYPWGLLVLHWLMGFSLVGDLTGIAIAHLFVVTVLRTKARETSGAVVYGRRIFEVPRVVYEYLRGRDEGKLRKMQATGPLPKW